MLPSSNRGVNAATCANGFRGPGADAAAGPPPGDGNRVEPAEGYQSARSSSGEPLSATSLPDGRALTRTVCDSSHRSNPGPNDDRERSDGTTLAVGNEDNPASGGSN